MATPKLASAGWAFITGLAILANPRVIPGSKTVVIDTQLYIGPTDDNLIIGSLRYFNSANLTFHDGPHLYAIVATVSILFSVFASANYIIFSLLNLDQNAWPICQCHR